MEQVLNQQELEYSKRLSDMAYNLLSYYPKELKNGKWVGTNFELERLSRGKIIENLVQGYDPISHTERSPAQIKSELSSFWAEVTKALDKAIVLKLQEVQHRAISNAHEYATGLPHNGNSTTIASNGHHPYGQTKVRHGRIEYIDDNQPSQEEIWGATHYNYNFFSDRGLSQLLLLRIRIGGIPNDTELQPMAMAMNPGQESEITHTTTLLQQWLHALAGRMYRQPLPLAAGSSNLIQSLNGFRDRSVEGFERDLRRGGGFGRQ